MRRLSLSTLLIGLNAGLVLIAVVAVAMAAVGLIGRFAKEQALARVNLAGASAQEAVERSARDVATSAHLLAERPTVKRLLGEGDVAGMRAFLDRFRGTSHLSGVVIFSQGDVFALGGEALPWEEIARRAGADGSSTLIRLSDGSLVLAAASPLAATSEASAAASLVLDPPFARQVEAQVGLPVHILDPDKVLANPKDPRMPLRAEVLATAEPGSGLLKNADRYLSVRPLRSSAGAVAALVETELPADSVSGSLARLVRNLFLLTLLVAALATLSGWAVSRRLTRPVEALTAAPARIGRGDLSTPAPPPPGAALGTRAPPPREGGLRDVVIASAPPAEEQQFQVMRDEPDVEAARRQRDAVLANISHEFRTPLSAQLASIELLRDRLLQSPGGLEGETRDLVLSLERGSLRLTQLIDNLLESVRIESGPDSIRSRPGALDEVLEEAGGMTARPL